MSPTIVTAKQAHVRAFIEQHQDVIVKPLDGMGGMGIFRYGTKIFASNQRW